MKPLPDVDGEGQEASVEAGSGVVGGREGMFPAGSGQRKPAGSEGFDRSGEREPEGPKCKNKKISSLMK